MSVVDVPVSCHDKLALLLLQSVKESVCDSRVYHASLRMLLLLQSVIEAGLGLLCTCKVNPERVLPLQSVTPSSQCLG